MHENCEQPPRCLLWNEASQRFNGQEAWGFPQENAGNDPTTQLVPSGQAGWSRGDGDTEQHHESRSSLIEKATWASGEAANHLVDQGPRPWDRVRSLNPQEFPSLSAAAHGNSNKQLAAAAALQNVSASEVQGNWDEDERSIATRPQGRFVIHIHSGLHAVGCTNRSPCPFAVMNPGIGSLRTMPCTIGTTAVGPTAALMQARWLTGQAIAGKLRTCPDMRGGALVRFVHGWNEVIAARMGL